MQIIIIYLLGIKFLLEAKVKGNRLLLHFQIIVLLFSNNNDLMFDSIKFGVGIITKDCFESFENANVHYSYSWKYNKSPKDDTEAKNKSDDFLKVLN